MLSLSLSSVVSLTLSFLLALALFLMAHARPVLPGRSFPLGVQDLAQDLPQDAVALELVLDRVREHDATVSNEQARNILVSSML